MPYFKYSVVASHEIVPHFQYEYLIILWRKKEKNSENVETMYIYLAGVPNCEILLVFVYTL